ncbi:hypothetical protein [Hymenobacter cellulosilyticus]|uniref:DUF5118 domain-containing protein n=1 Tax=Hymenobacter cellulosilyticus TaxID=2932248 RepID=A0A8T9QA84_9BACT|nr:hypothetical protein [Hymenobacter cellulosilyticus]UOQ73048.1 hypothetical protein MUN79_03475 [Hymenobacter cellulosilyticus]
MRKPAHLLPLLLLLALQLPEAQAQKLRRPPSPPLSTLATQERSGTLLRYTANPEGLYDGFIYQAGGSQDSVHFLPDMAKSLMNLAKPEQSITFKTAEHQSQQGAQRLELVSIRVGKKTLVMTLPPPPPPPHRPLLRYRPSRRWLSRLPRPPRLCRRRAS